MKIVHIVGHFPPFLGGMQNFVYELSKNLASAGHDVEIFTSDVRCKNNKIQSTSKLKINYLRSIEIAHTPIMFSLAYKLFTLPKESVIHLHVAQALSPEIVWFVTRLRGMRYIAQVHLDIAASGGLGFLLPIYKKIFLGKVLNDASKIIVPTSDYVELISNKYSINKNKIELIPYGVAVEKFNSKNTKELRATKQLLWVGRMTVQKNLPLLVDTLETLINRGYKDVHLNLVGTGEDKEEIADMVARKNLTDYVTFCGELTGDNLINSFVQSDIFVFTSRAESFGIVLVEAMAAGLAIVASDIPGIRNVVKDGFNGILSSESSDHFADAICMLIDDNSYSGQLVSNALLDSVNYSWSHILKAFVSVYTQHYAKNK